MDLTTKDIDNLNLLLSYAEQAEIVEQERSLKQQIINFKNIFCLGSNAQKIKEQNLGQLKELLFSLVTVFYKNRFYKNLVVEVTRRLNNIYT